MEKTSFADRYQSVLVPVIFEPWARHLIERAQPKVGEHILDLACGTGVVTRELSKLAPSPGLLVGVDHSVEMLDVARSLSVESGIEVKWIQADAGKLPFSDESFDLAFCQQALQFFPDRYGAVCELRRVLKPEGRAVFCIQREISVNPMLEAQAAALDNHIGEAAGDAVRSICSLSNGAEVRQLFEKAGFRHVEVKSTTLDLGHPDARAFAEGAIGGMHTGDKLAGLPEAAIDHAVDAFLLGLGDCLEGNSMHFPHVSNVVLARA